MHEDISPAARAAAAGVLACHSSELETLPVAGGFSHNRRSLVGHEGRWLFAKEVDAKLLMGDGSRERSWLRKDFDCAESMRAQAPEIVPDWEDITQDDSVLLITAMTREDGWQWKPPKEPQNHARYISSALAAIERLNSMAFSDDEATRCRIAPYTRDLLAFDSGFDMLLSRDEIRHQLHDEYVSIAQQTDVPILRQAFATMKLLLNDEVTLRRYAELAKQLHNQPELILSHSDVRVDNIAYHAVADRTVLIDFDWLSLAPEKFDSTEFLIDVTRYGVDVSPWEGMLNKELLAAAIGYYARRVIEDEDGRAELRQMKLESAAVAALLLKRII